MSTHKVPHTLGFRLNLISCLLRCKLLAYLHFSSRNLCACLISTLDLAQQEIPSLMSKMATTSLPSTMRIWEYASTAGGIKIYLHLHTSTPLPQSTSAQHLIQVLAVGLNPVEFRPAEAPLIDRLAVKLPATPGFDAVGRIVTPAKGSDPEAGQLVFGAVSTNPLADGALAEYAAVSMKTICKLSASVSPLLATGAPVAPVTAHDSIIPHVPRWLTRLHQWR